MESILPGTKPQLKREDAERLLNQIPVNNYAVRLLGIRGYYRQTMGKPNYNDRGIYDDAIFLVSPTTYAAFNANTDPSYQRRGIAVLKADAVYLYKVGLHNMKAPYEALRQYGRVTVLRDGKGEETDTAAAPFYVDIHKGGYGTTSSLGCQTIPPQQWDTFLFLVKRELNKFRQTVIPYSLIEASG